MYFIYLLDSSKLYQWDTNRKIQINQENADVDAVHFCHTNDEEALVVPVENQDGIYFAKIPNILLQSAEDIIVYLVSNGDTINQGILKVAQRQKPSDYIYTETEIVQYIDLNKKISNLYVTPEMFGAVGDGITDDSRAIQEALEKEVPVHFGSKTYRCKDIITKNIKNIHMKGTGRTVIQWLITETKNTDRDFTGMISDDDFQLTEYLNGGNILLENIIFDGNVDNITSFEKDKSAFGLCLFYNRDNVIVKNCTFQNCHADGLQARGLRRALKVDNSVFYNLGTKQPFDGTRNGITVGRDFWNRQNSEAGGVWVTNSGLTYVDISNSSFKLIADECIRADGISHLIMNNCTMNDIGHYILETGHRADVTNYTHILCNCIGNNIGTGLYTSGADGGTSNAGGYKHEGTVNIKNCNFTNLCYKDTFSAFKRHRQSGLITVYDWKSEIQPRIYIENSIIKGSDSEPESEIASHFLGGSFIYLKDTELYFKEIYALGVFTFSKQMIVENCSIAIDKIKNDDGGLTMYILMKEGSKVFFKNTDIKLKYIYSFISNGVKNTSITFEDCNISHSNNSYLFIAMSEQENTNIKLADNIFIGKLTGRCIQAPDTGQTNVNSLKIINNLFPNEYNTWGTISNLKNINYKVVKDNSNYSQ